MWLLFLSQLWIKIVHYTELEKEKRNKEMRKEKRNKEMRKEKQNYKAKSMWMNLFKLPRRGKIHDQDMTKF